MRRLQGRAAIVPILLWGGVAATAQGPNSSYTLSIRGPCGEVIEGLPGSTYDDGTAGLGDFERPGAGHTWDVVLTKEVAPDVPFEDRGITWGWVWAIGVEGPVRITAITGFCEFRNFPSRVELTGLPNGTGPQTEENHGALSWKVLPDHSRIDRGSWVVARIRVFGEFPETAGESVTARVFFTSRIGSTGAPNGPAVDESAPGGIRITPDSGNPPLALENCEVTFRAAIPRGAFIRCDANDDGAVDVSDPVRILNDLFVEGPQSLCGAASDCNGDRRIEIADAIFGLTYLFVGGPPPPAPFPRCAVSPETPGEECPAGSTRCP